MASAPHTVFAGTSGWAYGSWKPDFYPAKTPAAKLLSYYATKLNSVEVNYTFRQLPTPQQLEGWMAAVTPGFRFSFKAPQTITHMKRLRDAAEALAALDGALKPVEERGHMGVVLFQLPPNFRADVERLKAFLLETTRLRMRAAFEFRHASWFTEETFAVLEQSGAALCVAESDTLATPQRRTAEFTCYRLRRSSYTAAELDQLAEQFAQEAQRGDVYAYFMHEEEPDGPLRACALLEAIAR
jgi:uncharacterized protein YecE (DUF72 family)